MGDNTKRSCDECGMDNFGTVSTQGFKDSIWASQLQTREIIINGEIKDDLIERAVIQVFNINQYDDENRIPIEERQPIIIYLNSAGGLMDEAFSLISAIEGSRTPIITIALGKAYSAAFLILLAGHKRYAQKYTTLMYHQGSSGAMGEINRMIEYVRHWENCQEIVENFVISKTKIKSKQLREVFQNKKDWYMTVIEASELGIIDGIWEG